MTKSTWQVSWRLPDNQEIILFVLGFMFFGIFDYAQNHFQDVSINVLSIFGIKALTLFWIFILAYHVVLFTAIFRAYAKKGTHYVWDFMFGTLAILGVYIMIGGAIAGIYYGTADLVPWFFHLSQINFYHLGVFLQVITFAWFVSTD